MSVTRHFIPCPKCGGPGLQYLIHLDVYRCKYCGKDYEVEVETDHVMYKGFVVDGHEFT